jgi:hypothetical protein
MNRPHAGSIRRQTIRRSDAQTRWDQAYQHLLQWTTNREGESQLNDLRLLKPTAKQKLSVMGRSVPSRAARKWRTMEAARTARS